MQHDPSNVIQLRKPALMAHPRTPAEFEIVAVNYHCANVNVDQGHFFKAISNAAPLNKWFVRFLDGSPLQHPQWADFSDPSATTHHSYSILQDAQEKYLEALFDRFLKAAHNRAHIERWIAKWAPEADRAIEAFCTGLPDSVATAAAAKMSVLAYRSQALG